jgi:HPt (histidine-containing phosphotransfer) domain-containing protein
MPYTLTYTHGERMAVAEVSGLAFVDDAQEVVIRIQQASQAHGDRRLLINLADVVGTLEQQDHQLLGRLAATYLGHLHKVASLVPEDKITRVSEQAAQSLGVQLRVFTSLTAAVDWLVHD